MSLTGALNNAVSGLLATQRQIEVVSGNVSNAQTKGFSEKNAETTTQVLNGRAAGTQISQISRDVNPFLERELRSEQTKLQNTKSKSEIFKRVQDLFGTLDSDNAITNQIADLKSKFEQLAVEPGNTAARTQVVRQAQTVATRFNSLTQNIQELRTQTDTQIAESVKTINDNLKKLQTLNQDIASNKASGDPTANLKDKRDQALIAISKQIEIQTFKRDNGAISVFTNNGTPLLNAQPNNLSFDKTGSLQPGVDGNAVKGPTGNKLTSDVGGRLGGLIELRDNELPKLQQDLDRLAAKFREEINAMHNKGMAGNTAQGSITGSTTIDPDNQDSAPNVTASGRELSASGQLKLATVNADGSVATESTVNFSTATINNVGDLVNEINTQATNISASLTPDPENNGKQLKLETTNNKSLAINTNNTQIEPTSSSNSVAIGETAGDSDNNGTRDRNFSHFFGLNNFFETPNPTATPRLADDPNLVTAGKAATSAANAIQVREDIADNADLISRGTADTTPGAGALPTGDGSVAKNIADTFETDFQFNKGGNLSARATTFGGFAGDLIQFQASETSRLEENTKFQQETVDNLEFRTQSQAGVNIDEELAQLQQFQQAFNANARLVSTTQDLFQTLSRAVA